MAVGRLPLEGIRVADFSWYAAGPVATKILAAFGAQVIRVESFSRIDRSRIAQPTVEDKPDSVNCSGLFNQLHNTGGKWSFGLNMADPKGRALAERLILASDLVVENFTVKVMEKWGLTYDRFRELKPDLIWVDEPVHGVSGPYKYYTGVGSVICAQGGLNYLTGWPHRPPEGPGTDYTDYVICPGHLLVPILGALYYRRRTGKGQHIVMPQVQSMVAATGPAILNYTANGGVQAREGNRSEQAAPHGAYRCRGEQRLCTFYTKEGPTVERKNDRWCAIAVRTEEEWRAFCGVLGNPDWTTDKSFSTLEERKRNADALDRLIEEWTIRHTAEEVMSLMQQAGVPAGVVQDVEDVMIRDPHMRAREYYVYVDHPVAGVLGCEGIPFKLSPTQGRLLRAPMLGEHNELVCREVLGLSEQEFDEYLVEGVLEMSLD